jgi:hypothetical protein
VPRPWQEADEHWVWCLQGAVYLRDSVVGHVRSRAPRVALRRRPGRARRRIPVALQSPAFRARPPARRGFRAQLRGPADAAGAPGPSGSSSQPSRRKRAASGHAQTYRTCTRTCSRPAIATGISTGSSSSRRSDRNESNPDDYVRVVTELRRVLKPGGTLYLSVPFGTIATMVGTRPLVATTRTTPPQLARWCAWSC